MLSAARRVSSEYAGMAKRHNGQWQSLEETFDLGL